MSDAPLPSPSALSEEDRRLVAACLAAEPGAWESLVDRFGRLIAHVVVRTARQRGITIAAADREDLVADVLMELLRNDAACLRAFAGRASLPTYLTVISRRVAARRLHDSVPVHERRPHPRAAVPTRRPYDEARKAEREHVEALLTGLEANEARLVRLHHIEQRSYGEISHLTGMPLGSIGPALSRARDKMRRLDADAAERPSGPRATPTADQ